MLAPIPSKNPYPHPRRVYPWVMHTNYIESSYYKAAKCNKTPIPNDTNACWAWAAHKVETSWIDLRSHGTLATTSWGKTMTSEGYDGDPPQHARRWRLRAMTETHHNTQPEYTMVSIDKDEGYEGRPRPTMNEKGCGCMRRDVTTLVQHHWHIMLWSWCLMGIIWRRSLCIMICPGPGDRARDACGGPGDDLEAVRVAAGGGKWRLSPGGPLDCGLKIGGWVEVDCSRRGPVSPGEMKVEPGQRPPPMVIPS